MDSKSVIRLFSEITKIPRETGHEEMMGEFLRSFAQDHSLEFKQDSVGNVLITKQAAPGKEEVPTLVLQAHQDMVCEKNSGSSHDFAKDPIRFEIEDGWMIAKETTLGADDGIGIAACLALLESDSACGKIECLFTVAEEVGLDGAMGIEPGFFTGKTLINLDSEDEGELYVGCAGGMTTKAVYENDMPREIEDGSSLVSLRIYNGLGGHSGDDINKGRANTIYLMARFLNTLRNEYGEPTYSLVNFDGGNKHNAIARETEAVIAVPEAELKAVDSRFTQYIDEIAAEYAVTDSQLKGELKILENKYDLAFGEDMQDALVLALVSVFHGAYAMSQDIPGLVETSSNLASVKTIENGHKVEVVTSQRSSVDSALTGIAAKVAAAFEISGAEVVQSDRYPGWKPNLKSELLNRCVSVYEGLFGNKPAVKAIHAGLECGLFLEKFPGLDMISFGPTLRGVHAPGERLDLASNEKFVQFLNAVVQSYSK